MPRYEMNPESRLRGTEASPVTGEFDVVPFREAFERSGLTLTELAKRLGWYRPDQPRVGEALGIYKSKVGTGERRYRRKLCLHTATALCEALGVDPVDVGL